jgi:phage terminase small subunit
MGKLLNKQERIFVDSYLLTMNAAHAAKAAKYADSTADKKAPLWVGKSRGKCPKAKQHVWDAVKAALKARSDETKIDAAYVLQRHKEIDQLDILDIVTEDLSGVRPLSEWPKAWRISINAIDIADLFDHSNGGKELSGLIKKIKWPDKVKNLELLGKHTDVNAYKETVNHTGEMTHNIMPVPSCISVEDWEKQAQENQKDTQ